MFTSLFSPLHSALFLMTDSATHSLDLLREPPPQDLLQGDQSLHSFQEKMMPNSKENENMLMSQMKTFICSYQCYLNVMSSEINLEPLVEIICKS